MICVLEDRQCNECGKCDMCDLDAEKRCDNCCACLEDQSGDMRTIIVKKEELFAASPPKRKIYRWKPKD